MARPIKNNADYFPHDADMRNDPRVKALRRKFKLEGYAIYSMMIETLTDSDFFQVKNDKLTFEIIAGDFDCEVELLENVIQYCLQIDLFQLSETGILTCKSLNNRLNPLLSKRKREQTGVIVVDNAHSKVKERKVDEIKVDESRTLTWFETQIDEIFREQMQMIHKGKDLGRAISESYAHLLADPARLKNADSSDCKKILNTWLTNQKPVNGKHKTALPSIRDIK